MNDVGRAASFQLSLSPEEGLSAFVFPFPFFFPFFLFSLRPFPCSFDDFLYYIIVRFHALLVLPSNLPDTLASLPPFLPDPFSPSIIRDVCDPCSDRSSREFFPFLLPPFFLVSSLPLCGALAVVWGKV